MKKIALLLAALMLMSCLLAACGDKEEKSGSLVGTWEGSVDMTDTLTEALKSELGDGFSIKNPITMKLSMEFKDDGTMKCVLDAKDFASQIVNVMIDAVVEQSGQTREELEESMKDSLDGMSFEEYMGKMMNTDAMVSSMGMEDITCSYKLEDGKLYTWESGEEMDEKEYMLAKLDGSKLTLDAEEGVNVEGLEGMLPLELTKK